MTTNEPHVSIIIVLYNSEKYLPKLLKSLASQDYNHKKMEVVFVDNSQGIHLRYLNKLIYEFNFYIKFKYIKLKNLGYCLGNNIGFNYTNKNSKYLLVLNPDTYLENNFITELINYMERNPNIAIASSKVVYPYLNLEGSSKIYLDAYGSIIGEKIAKKLSLNVNFFYVSGAAIMIRRDVFIKLEGFDPWLFMYHDDVDLAWRARLLGFQIGYTENTKYYHLKEKIEYGHSLNLIKYYFMTRNRIRILIKNYCLSNLFKVLITILLIMMRGFYSSIVTKKAEFIIITLKAFKWNIINLKNTIRYRYKVQNSRKICDKKILNHYMTRKPIEIMIFAIRKYISEKDFT